MAGLLDFMGQPVAGQSYAQGPMPNGDAGVPMGNGPTYGDIAKAALQYGSKPGSSGPMLGGMVGNQYGQQAMQQSHGQAVANALQPLAEQPGSIMPQKQGGSDIWSWLLKLLG